MGLHMRKGRKGFLIIFLLAAAAAVFYGVRYIRRPVNTQVVTVSQHRDQITADAYLVKTEHVYQAQNAGMFYSSETEGARVGKQRQLASVYTGSVDVSTLTELNNINKKISESEQMLHVADTFSGETQTEENRTEVIKNKMIEAAEENNIAQIRSYKEELSSSLGVSSSGGGQASLDTLREQKAEVEQRLSGLKQDIVSDISGVYTTNVDGLEEALTPESILTYTVPDFDSLVKPQKRNTPVTVAAGDRVCKVVDNHTWSIMVKVSAADLAAYEPGTDVSLMFDASPGTQASARLAYKSEEKDGFVVAVFTSEQYIEGIFTIRTAVVDIIFHNYTGYRVPIYAIRVVDGQTGVMKQEHGSEVFCACDVLYTNQNEGYAVVYSTENAEHKLENGDHILLGEKAEESSS